MRYRVGFIDDEKDIIMTLQRQNNGKKFYLNNREVEIEIVEIELYSEIDQVIQEINNNGVSAVLVDYLLRNKRTDINYDGSDIINRLDLEKSNFPSFMLTGHGEEAENSVVDVNKIYKKPDYTKDPNMLNNRIIRQIENYNSRIKQAQEELNQLVKRRGELSLEEEDRLIELDCFIERSISIQAKLPTELKRTKNLQMLQRLIESTESILKEVRKGED